MRIGVLAKASKDELDWAKTLGFGSIQWVRFADTEVCNGSDWRGLADEVVGMAAERDVRISAIAGYYANALDPAQTENARRVLRRAIEVAAYLDIPTVSAFTGGLVKAELNPRGGHPVYQPLENFIPEILAFWEPIGEFAADHGVRIAFEHCPQTPFRQPVMTYNLMGSVGNWERFFDATKLENLGLEWDPSHLVCQLVDPVVNLRKFGSRVFHVHAKDGYVDHHRLAELGLTGPGVVEHRMPGFGQSNWSEIIHMLLRVGYDSDLNIEGWHDPVLRNHADDENDALKGCRLEDSGLRSAKQFLEQFVPR